MRKEEGYQDLRRTHQNFPVGRGKECEDSVSITELLVPFEAPCPSPPFMVVKGPRLRGYERGQGFRKWTGDIYPLVPTL